MLLKKCLRLLKGEIIMIPNELKEMIVEIMAVALEYDAQSEIKFEDGNVKITVTPKNYYGN